MPLAALTAYQVTQPCCHASQRCRGPVAGPAAWPYKAACRARCCRAECAMQSLEAAGAQQGQRVLIHAGAGGVGSFAVQLAKARGAHVITTAGPRNIDFVQKVPPHGSTLLRIGQPSFEPCSGPCSNHRKGLQTTAVCDHASPFVTRMVTHAPQYKEPFECGVFRGGRNACAGAGRR